MKIIPLASVVVNKRQRSSIAAKPLLELKESILNVGLLHPPVMWEDMPGTWVLSVGERRLRAIQELSKEGHPFNHGDAVIPPGNIAITPLGDYLDEVGRFEAELDENIRREVIPWQDQIQAMADLHAMRSKANPKQTLTATAQELTDRGAFAPKGDGTRKRLDEVSTETGSTARNKLSNAVVIAQHLDDPHIANARNESEAIALIYKKEEEKANAELIRRRLITMAEKPTLEVRLGDLLVALPAMEASVADLILADPPYGVDANAGGFRGRTVLHHNYKDDPETAKAIARCILVEGFRITKPQANLFIFCNIEYWYWLTDFAKSVGWKPFMRPLTWAKSESEGLAPWGGRGPRITTESILYATKGLRGMVASPIDVFRVKRVPRSERLHAAEKPVELLRALIECSTHPGELVLDPCCGSGSTLVACRESKRLGIGIEKDPNYFNTALSNVHSGGFDGSSGSGDNEPGGPPDDLRPTEHQGDGSEAELGLDALTRALEGREATS